MKHCQLGIKRNKKKRNGPSGLKGGIAQARQQQDVGGAETWKMCGWILLDFDEAMTIQCIDIALTPKMWRKMAAKSRNSASQDHMPNTCGSYLL